MMPTIMNRFKKLFSTGFFHIFGSSVVNKIIGFLSSIVLVRLLTKYEYGVFTYAWNIYGFVLLLQGMGVGSGVLQLASEHSGDEDYADNIANYGARFGLKFNTLLALALVIIALFIPLKISASRSLIMLLSLLPLIQLLFQLTLDYLRALKRNIEYSRLTLFNTIVLFVSSVFGAVLLREKGLVFGYYFAFISSYLVSVYVYKIHILKKRNNIKSETKKVLLKIAFISMCNNGLSQLMYLLDIFVIGLVDPSETVLASYKVATMIPAAMIFIPQALVTYIYPYFAENKDNGRWCINHYKQVVVGMGLTNICISSILFFGAPFIIKLVFGSQYLDALPVFRVLAINYFFSGTFRTIAGNLLVTQRKLSFNFVVGVIAGIINIFADYFFVQWWGAIGAAYTTLLVVLFTSLLYVIYLILTFNSKKNDAKIGV